MTTGVIDLGSNTFHLLISEISPDTSGFPRTVFRKSYMTGLSKAGGSFISDESMQKAVSAIQDINIHLNTYPVDKIRVVGTAVLRSASNRDIFIQQAENILGCPIHVISGQEEASYIAKGSCLHPAMQSGNHVVLDIGGGSTECIILENGKTSWMESTSLGVGILNHTFFNKEKLTTRDIEKAHAHFDQNLKIPRQHLSSIKVDSLAGASGTFETIEVLLTGHSEYNENTCIVDLADFEKLYQDLVFSDLAYRLSYPRMPKERANLMPAGLILIGYMLQLIKPSCIRVTKYALKEGVASELSGSSAKRQQN